jgi:hypothetical protein
VILEKWEDRLKLMLEDEDEEKKQLPGSIPTSYNDSRTECAICLQELRHDKNGNENGDKRVLTLVDFKGACGHSFHVSCLSTWLDNRNSFDQTLQCPVCKKPILDKWVDATYNRIRGKRPEPQPSHGMTLRELEDWRRARERRARRAALRVPDQGLSWRLYLMEAYEELLRASDEAERYYESAREMALNRWQNVSERVGFLRVGSRWLQIIRTLSEQARRQEGDPRRNTNLW